MPMPITTSGLHTIKPLRRISREAYRGVEPVPDICARIEAAARFWREETVQAMIVDSVGGRVEIVIVALAMAVALTMAVTVI